MAKNNKLIGSVIKGFENVIFYVENKWETTHSPSYKVYNVFRAGMKETFTDFHTFVRLRSRIIIGEDISSFTRAEISVMRKVPKDTVRLIPAVIMVLLPGSVLFLPILHFFPRLLLTRRFWNDQQKEEFSLINLSHQLNYQSHLVKILTKEISRHDLPVLKQMVSQMEKRVELKNNDLLSIAKLFQEKPLAFQHLSYLHQYRLCRIHGINRLTWLGQMHTMKRHALLLSLESQAILREGLDALDSDDLIINICLDRGVNPYKMSREERLQYINKWCHLCSKVPQSNYSFVLHLPTFLGYPHPANNELLKTKKQLS